MRISPNLFSWRIGLKVPLAAILALTVHASAQPLPPQILGHWIEIGAESGEPDEMQLSIKGDKIVIDDAMGGEGLTCALPMINLQINGFGHGATSIALIQGQARCQAEENPPTKPTMIIVYSKADHSERLFITASDGWATPFRRK